MTVNEGRLDRFLRAIIGAVLIGAPLASGLALFADPIYFRGALIAGAVMLATSITGFCPIYRIVGVGTCKSC